MITSYLPTADWDSGSNNTVQGRPLSHLLAIIITIYVKIFAWQNFAKPSYLCIAEIFSWINFHQCGKGRHILYVIINTRQKIRVVKILPMRADGEIGENFLLVKISVYTVLLDAQ